MSALHFLTISTTLAFTSESAAIASRQTDAASSTVLHAASGRVINCSLAPLTRRFAAPPEGHILDRFAEAVIGDIHQSLTQTDLPTFERACALLAEVPEHTWHSTRARMQDLEGMFDRTRLFRKFACGRMREDVDFDPSGCLDFIK